MGALHSNGANWCRRTMGNPTYKLVSLVLPLLLVSCGQAQQVSAPEESTVAVDDTDVSAATNSSSSHSPIAPAGEIAPESTTSKTSTAAPDAQPLRSSPVSFAKKDCSQVATQIEMNQCAADNYRVADQALNQVYQDVLQNLDNAAKAQLSTAEERWLVFRDAHCTFESDRFQGGSIAPLIQASCMEQVTDNRIAELKQTVKAEGSHAEADAKLNDVYQAIQALASDAAKETLTDVQLTWIDYRDAHCDFEANRLTTTDINPCLAAITETRVWQLETLKEDWSL